jgi:hypothetical protein
VDTRGYHRTLTRKGTVFTGTGTGPGKNTRGLPVSFPIVGRLCIAQFFVSSFKQITNTKVVVKVVISGVVTGQSYERAEFN